MKTYKYFALAAIFSLTFASCDETDKGKRFEGELTGNYSINSISAGENLYKTFELTFDESGRMTQAELLEGEWSELWELDYSASGRIGIGEGRYFVLNDKGLITEFVKNQDESLVFEYNADGYMIKITEYWQGTPYPKSTLTVSDGNITSYSKWMWADGDNEETEHFRIFTYGSRENPHGIYQVYSEAMKDYEWLYYTGHLGEPSKNLADSFIWDYNIGDPEGNIDYIYSYYGDAATLKLFKTSDEDNTKARTYGYRKISE